jgi:hypothetical protein
MIPCHGETGAARPIASEAGPDHAAGTMVISGLILLAEAALAPPTPRLSAGVKVIRPVASSEAPPFDRLGAAIVVRKSLLSKPTQPIS